MRILDALNEAQKEAVCHTEGPLLILAGAGSGKTRVLTYRIAYLLHRGVPPDAVLAVTFTNKAAGEMRKRVEALVGPNAQRIWVGTFHATCARLLRQEGREIGLDPRFTIYDTQDQLAAVKEAMGTIDLSEKNFPVRSVLGAIGAAKNSLLDPADYERTAADFWAKNVARVYHAYQEVLRRCKALDFDDLLTEAVRLFQTRPGVLGRYQDRWRYILIDEYQDTNHAQYALVKLLAQKHRNICVVGDDDQSIYGFRQADIRNILEFERDYPEARVIKLEQNYRSTATILNAANEVIRHNRGRKSKRLWTENAEGAPVTLHRAQDERLEAVFVVDEIQRLVREEGRSPADFALLYRTNAQSRPFEEILIQRGLPYRVIGGLRFYERKEIRDILAYLRLLGNPADVMSFRRVVNLPRRGIGEATVEKVIGFALAGGMDLHAALAAADGIPGLTAKVREALKAFGRTVAEIAASGLSVLEMTRRLLEETGYLAELRAERTPEAEARLENIDEFLALTAQFGRESDDPSLNAFLEMVALVAEVDNYEPEADALVLMTLHAAKGLEFPVVFLAGMEEGIFPHARSVETGDIEEERRLCYVGITRARDRLYLTHAGMRTIYGETRPSFPSRFLREIPPELTTAVAHDELLDFVKRPPAGRHRVQAARGCDSYHEGERVAHPKWGTGTVVGVSGTGDDAIIAVAFAGLGIKKLAVAYAGLVKEASSPSK
ncbi:MAG: DNA helicase PcrA [Bacteroidota bacterium]